MGYGGDGRRVQSLWDVVADFWVDGSLRDDLDFDYNTSVDQLG